MFLGIKIFYWNGIYISFEKMARKLAFEKAVEYIRFPLLTFCYGGGNMWLWRSTRFADCDKRTKFLSYDCVMTNLSF